MGVRVLVKIKDRVMLSIVGTLISLWPGRILSRVLLKEGVIDFNYDRLGAGLFLKRKAAKSTAGQVTGMLVNEINVALASLVITYTLALTGRDKAVLKGLGIGLSFWVLINGLLTGSVLKIKSAKPWTPLINAALHMVSGGLTGFVISRIGDDSLFPDRMKGKVGKDLPVWPMAESGSKR